VIKRKTDRDQQAYSYTTRRRCSEYQMSLPLLGGLQTQHGESRKVSESVAAAATRAVLR